MITYKKTAGFNENEKEPGACNTLDLSKPGTLLCKPCGAPLT